MKNCERKKVGIFVITFFCLLLPLQPESKEEVLVIKGGEIHTVSGDVIQKGILVLKDGKIQSVGKNIAIPKGARKINAEGLIVTPGIIDARSNLGVREPRNVKSYFDPARRIIEFFTPIENSTWLKGGVTTTYITPPPNDILGGFGAVVKLIGSKEEAVISDQAGMSVSFGEFAFRGIGTPSTRQGRLGKLRQEFIRAQEYLESQKAGKNSGESGESEDTESEAAKYAAIFKVLNREVPIRVFVNTPDDIMAALRIAKEFNLRMVIDSGAGAHKVAHFLAEADVPVVVGPSIMSLGSGGPFEMFAHTPENASRLYEAGVKVALSTNSRGGSSILEEGVVAKSHGLPEVAALRAITLAAAEILGVADRLGSIEPGKDADLVLWKGHPLSTWGETQTVIVNGKIVFERE